MRGSESSHAGRCLDASTWRRYGTPRAHRPQTGQNESTPLNSAFPAPENRVEEEKQLESVRVLADKTLESEESLAQKWTSAHLHSDQVMAHPAPTLTSKKLSQIQLTACITPLEPNHVFEGR